MATPLPLGHDESVVAEATQYAVTFHQRGMLAEAEKLYAAILEVQPDHFQALHLRGVLRQQLGDGAEAKRLITAALKMNPRSVDALCSLGGVLNALNLNDEALDAYDKALAIDPAHVDGLVRRATTLAALNRREDALTAVDAALRSAPGNCAALAARGNMLLRLDRAKEALAAFDRALAIEPRCIEALIGRGSVLVRLGRVHEALAAFDRVIEMEPGHAAALHGCGLALASLERHGEALKSLDKALRVAPGNVALLSDYGAALLALGRAEDALAAFDKALIITPDRPDALRQRAAALRALGRHAEARASEAGAVAAVPHDAEALYSRANSLWALGNREEAVAILERASAFNHPRALSKLAICRLAVCDWAGADELAAALRRRVAEANFVDPLTCLAFGFEPSVQLEAAKVCVRMFAPLAAKPLPISTSVPAGKLRLAYLSANFRQQAVGVSIAELLTRHDRARFEIIGVSYGPNDASDTGARLVNSCDRFHHVASEADRDIARLVNELGVHIAVDLNGLTGGCRPGVLAYRPAPIQVGYLGFAGTTGSEFTDYILADATVLPFDQQPFFTEKIVHLPDCYHANDTTRPIAQTPPRRDLGLPDQGFVFCCFNQSYKIAAPVFDVWMRLLARVQGSVLWLSKTNDLAQANLRRTAAARGVDPERLVFAPWMDKSEDHLARHRAADLFLDTLPYNAHSTAIDALWAGLPVLTCAGTAFAGRVGASLLKAAGLPELVTHGLADYEAMALRLAGDPALLSSLRRKLADNRPACALFDGDRFRRHVEAAYAAMWDIHRRGERPRGFCVAPAA